MLTGPGTLGKRLKVGAPKFVFLLSVVAFLFGCVTNRPPVKELPSFERNSRGFDHSRYHPSKLIDVAKEYDKVIEADIKNAPAGKAFILIESLSRAIRVKAEFTNEFRTPSEEHITVVKAWLRAFEREKYMDLFQHEVKIREDNIEYWLPIQEQLVPFLQKETRPGEVAEFYIVYLGAHNVDHVLVINEFQKIL
jgi:hypothetical protein